MTWQKDLLAEKNLREIFCKSSGLLNNKFNFRTTLTVFVFALVWVGILASFYSNGALPITALGAAVRSWISLGISFSATILGFLISGFTVFATLSRPKIFVELAQTKSKADPALSDLKYIFFMFMNVFIHYISYLSFSVAVDMLVVPYGLLSLVLFNVSLYYPSAKFVVGSLFFVFYAVWTAIVLLKLKSFVWNVYSGVMLSIATYDEDSMAPPTVARPTGNQQS